MAPELRRDQAGQMMLLSAVVLIFAFLALAAMVSRVSQLDAVTGQDQSRPILLEIESAQGAVQGLLSDLDAVGLEEDDYEAALAGALEHLAFLERARGFRLDLTSVDVGDPLVTGECTTEGQVLVVDIDYSLSDGEVKVRLVETSQYTCHLPPPPP